LLKTKVQSKEAKLADFLLMGLGATLASPIAWEHHYGVLFPIFVCVWLILWFGDVPLKSVWIKVAFVAFYLIAANVFPFAKFVADSYLNVLQSYLFFAALGLFIILLLIKHQLKPKANA
jgi:alpha-1,2-mannosyltransferase